LGLGLLLATTGCAKKPSMKVSHAEIGGVWLPAGKTTKVSTPIAIPMDVALALVGQAYVAPTIPFRLTGKADVVASSTLQIEKDDYSVDESGSITRAQFEAILPNTFRR
jgi:hypothetical protein